MNIDNDVSQLIENGIKEKLREQGYEIKIKDISAKSLKQTLDDFDNEDVESFNQNYVVSLKKIEKSEDPKNILKSADILFDSGDYQLAKKFYFYLIKEGHTDASVLTKLSKCFLVENQENKALRCLEEAIVYSPLVETLELLSELSLKRKEYEKSAQYLDRALKVEGISVDKKIELHKNAGQMWIKSGNQANSEKNFQFALALSPRDENIYNDLGSLYLQSGRISDAIRCYETGFAINKKNTKAILGLGSCLLIRGEKERAFEKFHEALNLNINQPSAIFYLLKLTYELKKYSKSEPVVEKFIDCSPYNLNLLYCLAGIKYHLEKYLEAEKFCKKILASDPKHVGALKLQKKLSGRMNESTGFTRKATEVRT